MLFDHQKVFVEWAGQRCRMLLADDTGLGKTKMALAAIDTKSLPHLPTLIVAPGAALQSKWLDEVRQLSKYIYHCSAANQDNLPLEGHTLDYIVTNYEAISSTVRAPWLKTLLFRNIIFDECHYIKSRQAQRTRAWRNFVRDRLVPNGKVIGLTATPITRTPEDLLTQLDVIGALWCDLYKALNHYCYYVERQVAANRTVRQCIGWHYHTLDDLKRMLSTVMISRRKDEVIDLPDIVDDTFEVKVDQSDFANQLTSILSKLEHPPPLDAIKTLEHNNAQLNFPNLENAVGGLVVINALLHSAGLVKAPHVAERVREFLLSTDDRKSQVAIFCKHIDVAMAICDALNNRHEQIIPTSICHGQLKAEDRIYELQQFKNGTRKVLIGTYGTAGFGIDLINASHVILAEQDWNPATSKQARDRLHRIGQTKKVLCQTAIAVYDGVAMPIERRVYKVLQDKMKLADAVNIKTYKQLQHAGAV